MATWDRCRLSSVFVGGAELDRIAVDEQHPGTYRSFTTLASAGGSHRADVSSADLNGHPRGATLRLAADDRYRSGVRGRSRLRTPVGRLPYVHPYDTANVRVHRLIGSQLNALVVTAGAAAVKISI